MPFCCCPSRIESRWAPLSSCAESKGDPPQYSPDDIARHLSGVWNPAVNSLIEHCSLTLLAYHLLKEPQNLVSPRYERFDFGLCEERLRLLQNCAGVQLTSFLRQLPVTHHPLLRLSRLGLETESPREGDSPNLSTLGVDHTRVATAKQPLMRVEPPTIRWWSRLRAGSKVAAT